MPLTYPAKILTHKNCKICNKQLNESLREFCSIGCARKFLRFETK